MKLIITETYEEMSQLGTSIILGEMLQDKRVNLAITTGQSPQGIYQNLVQETKKYFFENVHYYNFDELRAPDQLGEAVSISELKAAYLKPAKVKPENIHQLTEENYLFYDQLIAEDGGLDLMLLGLGGDGHFCGNMPHTTSFDSATYQVPIKKEYAWYKTFEEIYAGYEIPETFVTMGPKSVMKVKRLLMVVNGEKKAAALKALIEGPLTPAFPSSILRLHPNLLILADKAAAAQL